MYTISYSWNAPSVSDYDEMTCNLPEKDLLADIPDLPDEGNVGIGDIVFTSGSIEDLEKLVHLIAASEEGIRYENTTCIQIHTGSDFIGNEPDLDYAGTDEDKGCFGSMTQRQRALLRVALAMNRPMGACSVYNDNYHDARPIKINFYISEPSMHERAEARPVLRGLMKDHLAKEVLDQLIPEG